MSLAKIGQKAFGYVAKAYQARVIADLKPYGLRYDDIKIEQSADVVKALARIPDDEKINRTRRLKRAIDIDFKGHFLSPEVQAMQTPLEPYLAFEEEEAKLLRQERELLNGPSPWM